MTNGGIVGYLTLWERYLMALERAASPRSKDFSRVTVYSFHKYCRRCNSGMKTPVQHARRTFKALFKAGFCSDPCQEEGPRAEGLFKKMASQSASGFRENVDLEDMLDLAVQMKKEEDKRTPMQRLVYEIDRAYHMLSEKLSALEMITKERWGASKFFYWLRKK